MKKIENKQNGFTIVELMIGIVIGLIVIAGATNIFISTVSSSSSTLKMSKLNQELNSVMTIITNDIRRAGYNGPTNNDDLIINYFNQYGTTALSVRTSKDVHDYPGDQGSGECILYSYDYSKDDKDKGDIVNEEDAVNDDELFGFRHNGTVIEMRTTVAGATNDALAILAQTTPNIADNCNNGTWVEVTDPQLISVDRLTFSLENSACLNVSKSNGIDDDGEDGIDEEKETNCYDENALIDVGDITVEVRVVDVTITGSLVNDSLIKETLFHSIRVRNDLVRRR